MKGKRVLVASLWEGVSIHVVLCWLWLMLQAALMFAGERVWLWEWPKLLSSQQQEGASVLAPWMQVVVAAGVPLSWEGVGVAEVYLWEVLSYVYIHVCASCTMCVLCNVYLECVFMSGWAVMCTYIAACLLQSQ